MRLTRTEEGKDLTWYVGRRPETYTRKTTFNRHTVGEVWGKTNRLRSGKSKFKFTLIQFTGKSIVVYEENVNDIGHH